MKIAGVEFPEPLLRSLQDGRLVVFAGAGVSMGKPANLPSFRQLAERVADGTGESIGDRESEDRFLGRLEDRGVAVHRIAAETLRRNDPEPTELHGNLVRWYSAPDDLRIVTTNFDPLFEWVAKAVVDAEPKVFLGPALPLGSRFRGIVHLHGSMDEPDEMVLTHRDFGRAYLTEANGWASRFVVDLFTNYTVLFVGYSHSDTIMTYLTPSLPPDEGRRRFALVGDKSDDLDHWRRMGVEPITFPQDHAGDFCGLNAVASGLADFMERRVLDWQQTITAVAGAHPPVDDESAAIVEHALADPELTRFFIEAATLPQWIDWLDRRGYLDNLFTEGGLNEPNAILSYWLASRFAVARSDELLSTIARHGGRLNSHLWNRLVWSLRNSDETSLDAPVLEKWVHFLANSLPAQIDHYALSGLIVSCAALGAHQSLLRAYDMLTGSRYQVRPAGAWDTSLNAHIRMEKLWETCLEPHLPQIAHSLLDRTSIRLEERRAAMLAWGEGNDTWDPDSYGRSAIEPHSQDDLPRHIDTLVNVARGCLEWLAVNDPRAVGTWCDRFVGANTPLLRRLAIHATSARADLSGDDRLLWLLEHCDVNELATHHEIFRSVAGVYPHAQEPHRQALIEAVLKYRAPSGGWLDLEPEIVTAHHHYNWFHWLHQADPDCEIARAELDAMRDEHPDFASPDHPDFTHWSQSISSKSPWNAEELLAKPAGDWVDDLLVFQPTDRDRVDGLGRWELLQAVGDAVGRNPAWGLDLADVLADADNWDSDLWSHMLMGWEKAELTAEEIPRLLERLSSGELQARNARLVADTLCNLVQHGEGSLCEQSLQEANSIASTLQAYTPLEQIPNSIAYTGGIPHDMGWLYKANNHLAGKLALFWIHSVSLWRKLQEPPPSSLRGAYRIAFDAVIDDDQITGKLGRSVLASQFNFLLAADETWALENLLPLFDVGHEDFQCAWDGFLTWGRLSPPVAQHLRSSLIGAVRRIDHDFNRDTALRFAEFYVAALGWFVTGANDEWVTGFFEHAGSEARRLFALQVGRRLRNLDETQQREWWEIWLKEYWEHRLLGVPFPLDDEEVESMLGWVAHLTGVFPEAVEVASRMRVAPLNHSLILHDLEEAHLTDRHPKELTKFLLHLSECETEPWFWMDIRGVVDRLLAKGLPIELELGLRELLARHAFR